MDGVYLTLRLPAPWITGVGEGGGTSASTPIVAAMFNRIVEERLRASKGPLGFINLVLYQHPGVLKNIAIGNNAVCCDGKCNATTGFRATPGWDPVTGLGTPDYPKMLELFAGLP
ncbi:uncharacterized protein LTR77_005202 [Saxophila tyrrhenica]|uniref:Peptidase S53 domain-containing protein n=1 Tax=Saxophila tyrrhenica TaxID=1690608 RepID=A0AAV9PFD0_9PEZI|nr:hypothetical protein LTR77_005202 [Saxophila tyrrhenica]